MAASHQPEYDSRQDHYDEYSSLVRASYNRLFEALLEDELGIEPREEPRRPA